MKLIINIIFILLKLIYNDQYSYSTYPFIKETLSLNINCDKGIYDNGYLKKVIISNRVNFTKDVKEIENGACLFNHSDNNSLYSDTLNLPLLNESVITFFIKPGEYKNDTERAKERPFISLIKDDQKSFLLITIKENTYIKIKIQYTEEEVVEKEEYLIYSSESNDIKNWTFMVITLMEEEIKIYVNGTYNSKFKLSLNQNFFSEFDHFYIGGNPNDNSTSYNGSLDEINIYDMTNFKDKITEERIRNLYINSLCRNGKYYNETLEKCDDCEIENCVNCYNKNYCINCSNGYLFNTTNKKCECQRDNCKECNENGECINCLNGFHINERMNCEKNDCSKLDHCLNCYSEEICYECNGKYELKKGKCKPFQKAIIGVIIVYIATVIVIWIVVIVVLRPRLMK